jgi:hypothetical protein
MADTAAGVATAAEPPADPSGGLPAAPKQRRAQPVTWTSAGLVAGLAGLAVATVLVLMHLGRGTTFFFDEWDWIEQRRTGLVKPLLRPHNGHLSAVPVAIYRLLFALVGLRHYTVFRATAIAFELLCVALLVIVVRRHLPPLLVLVAAAALLLYGPGWQDLLWPFQIGYTASLASGLAAVILLRRRDRLGDALAAVCLVISVASSGVGLALLAGVAVLLAVARAWRRLWVVAVPVVVYGIWYETYGVSEVRLANLPKLPAYMSTTAGATVGGLLGLRVDYGRFFCGVLATLLVVAAVRYRRVPPTLAFAVVSVIAVWAAYGLARGQLDDPSASRYLYPGAILLVLAAAEAPRRRVHPAVAIGLAVILPFTIWSNSKVFRRGAEGLRTTSQVVRVELGALEVAGGRARASFQPDTSRMPQVSAGPYLAAARALGSPAASVPEIQRSSEALREDADAVLAAAYASAPAIPAAGQACASLSPGAAVPLTPGHELVVHAPPGGAGRVWLRRFADGFRPTPDAVVAPGGSWAIALPVDRVEPPWEVRVSGANALSCS